MKNVLSKIQDNDRLGIEDTMWLYKQKETILKN